jgi:hypothetical protein
LPARRGQPARSPCRKTVTYGDNGHSRDIKAAADRPRLPTAARGAAAGMPLPPIGFTTPSRASQTANMCKDIQLKNVTQVFNSGKISEFVARIGTLKRILTTFAFNILRDWPRGIVGYRVVLINSLY